MANQGKSLNTVGGIEQANAIQRELQEGKQKPKVRKFLNIIIVWLECHL
jgi:hypothetical protein